MSITKKPYGVDLIGREMTLYTMTNKIGASVSVLDFGAHRVSIQVPDKNGKMADVCLGFDCFDDYDQKSGYLGATVGRNANRIQGAAFRLNGKEYTMTPNENGNNLHSGPDYYFHRMWKVVSCTDSAITLELNSPHGDQGFPGNAVIRVTYSLDADHGLHIAYNAVCDQDTVFNLTNHSYFNLRGHEHPEAAMDQLLTLPGRFFNPDDAEAIPTGEKRSVEGTPMDFRVPKPIGQDLGADYECLKLQGGYDHNWEVFCNPCAQLHDPVSGRSMAVYTDCPGIQFYSGNFLDAHGKGGVYYGKNAGVALETQYYPDALHHPDWPQPITKAGQRYHSQTVYRFQW